MRENAPPITVASINGVYGVRGWVKIMSYTRPREKVFTYSPWLIELDGDWREIDIEHTRHQGDKLLVKFAGLDTPEEARRFLHCKLAVKRDQLPPLADGDCYWVDLMGLEVIDQGGHALGVISEILETGANDVLVVEGMKEERILIPLVKEVYIKRIDLKARQVHVDWQSGEPGE